jgi:plastocyanin
MKRIPSLASEALFLLAALAADCGSGITVASEHGPASIFGKCPGDGGYSRDRRVKLKFEQATVTVHAGDVVKWKNDDITAHTVTADGKAGSTFDSGAIRTGSDWLYLAQHKGIYDYVFAHHPT